MDTEFRLAALMALAARPICFSSSRVTRSRKESAMPFDIALAAAVAAALIVYLVYALLNPEKF